MDLAVHMRTDAGAALIRGERLLAAGHAEAAIAAMRPAAASAEPVERAAALDGIGRALLALDRPDQALGFAAQALASHAAPAIAANHARVLLRLGRVDDALVAAGQALTQHPTEPRALAVRHEARAARGEMPQVFAEAPAVDQKAPPPKPISDALANAPGTLMIGVCWTADRAADPMLDDPSGTAGAMRFSASLDLCLRFLAMPGAKIVILRRGPSDARLRLLAELGIVVDPCSDHGADDAALASVIARVDLVAAVDSRVAELATLMNKPGIVLLPAGAVGRWPDQGGEPPRSDGRVRLKLLRQPKAGDWETPFRAAAELVVATLRQRPKPRPKPVPPKLAKQAQTYTTEGNKLHAAGDNVGGARLWRKALAIDPTITHAWGNMGVTLRIKEDPEAAIVCYRQALAIGGSPQAVIGNLGNALKDCDRLDEAIACHLKSVELTAEQPTSHHNLGISFRQAGRYKEAIAAFERALALKPGWNSASWDLALARLHVGDFKGGWPLYEARWQLGELSMPKLSKPLWDGGPIPGQTILLHSEQGFGDAIQCVRYAQALKQQRGAARVLLDCKPPLARLFATVQGVDLIVPRGERLPAFDVHCPLNSLPGLFGTDTATIPGTPPFVQAPPGAAAKFAPALALAGNRLKVGIVWSGSVTFKDNHHRAASLKQFFLSFGLPEVCLFSLQKGPPEAELRLLGPDAPVVDLAPLIEDFADTAAVIGELDLVLMTDSSVAHLCGALDRPVWVLLPYHAHWLWLENDHETTPWYPSMRFFRQARTNDWSQPFERAADELIRLAREKGRSA